MNIDQVALASFLPALKVVKTGSGTITAPAATSSNSPQSNVATIPHDQNSNNVFFAVIINGSAVYGSTRYINTPWSTPDGRVSVTPYVDGQNLYIKATSSTAGADQPATSFPYIYTILIP